MTKPTSVFEATVSDLLARGHGVRFEAAGDSMYPSIRSGDRVQVSPLNSGSPLYVGDVVLARAHRGLTVHRIVELHPGAVITRGDNAIDRDRIIERQAILGRVLSVAAPPPRARVYARRLADRILRALRYR